MLKKLQTNLSETPASLKDEFNLKRGPHSKYKPHTIADGPSRTAEELAAGSTVLQRQREMRAVPPPPRRGMPNPSPSSPVEARPALPTRASSTASSTSSFALPSQRSSPAPPYAANSPTHGPKPFSQYTQEDKEEFFAMMDSFFKARLGERTATHDDAMAVATRPSHGAPPPETSATSLSGQPSYPPPQSYSSSALTLVHYLIESPFTSTWYSSDSSSPLPPPLVGRADMRWSGSWSQRGDQKSAVGFCLFGDASVAWWKIDWSSPSRAVLRDAMYRPIPPPWDGESLYAASEMYGPILAQFAAKALAGRRPVGRGECWDVANEGLNEVQKVRPDLPEPFPSIGRTHGHLLFYAKAGNSGIWRGGDVYVREGDIVEWRKVTIREVGMGPGSYSTLGDPDHTAIITATGDPSSLPEPDQPYAIASLNSITVVEQSQGQLPSQKTYDLTTMSAGEIWIYRPVSLVDFVGAKIEAVWPPPCRAWRLGELE